MIPAERAAREGQIALHITGRRYGRDVPTHLLDPTVLIALVVEEHEHHAAARAWVATAEAVAVCPTSQAAFVRALTELGEPPQSITAVLRRLLDRPGGEFWPDSVSYADVDLTGVRRPREAVAAYLVALARARSGVVATFDEALAASAPDAVVLVHSRP